MAQTYDAGYARRYKQSQEILGAGTPYANQQKLLRSTPRRAHYSRIRDPLIRQSVFLSQTFPDGKGAGEWLRKYDVRKGGGGINAYNRDRGFSNSPGGGPRRLQIDPRTGRPIRGGYQGQGRQRFPASQNPPGVNPGEFDRVALPREEVFTTHPVKVGTPTTVPNTTGRTTFDQATVSDQASAATQGNASTAVVNPKADIPQQAQNNQSQIRSQTTGFSGNRRFHPFGGRNGG